MTHITVLGLRASPSLSELADVLLPYPFDFRLNSVHIFSMLMPRSCQYRYALSCCGLLVAAVAIFGIVSHRCTGPDLPVDGFEAISEHVTDFVSILGYGLGTDEEHCR